MEKPIHILLVDDDPDFLRVYGGQLSQLGYEVLYAHDGNEGREMARRLQPQLILLDFDMPVMDGLTAAMHMKTEEFTKNIPIIMLTSADLSLESERAFKELGIDVYLHKGAPMEVARSQIEKMLSRPPLPEKK